MRKIIHYQIEQSKALCNNRITENVSDVLVKVTCFSCIKIKRMEQYNKGVDYEAIERYLKAMLYSIEHDLTSFYDTSIYKGKCTLENYPPRISISLYIPRKESRHKSIMYNNIEVYIPNYEELDIAAEFISSLGELYNLIPNRIWSSSLVLLEYELKVKYKR